jgi:hypothetical protein
MLSLDDIAGIAIETVHTTTMAALLISSLARININRQEWDHTRSQGYSLLSVINWAATDSLT